MLVGLVIFGILSGYLATVLTNVTMVHTGDDVLLYGTEVGRPPPSPPPPWQVFLNWELDTQQGASLLDRSPRVRIPELGHQPEIYK